MAEETVTVTLTLRKPVAEKLRAICHARAERASLVVDRWILMADDGGNIGAAGPTDPREVLLDAIRRRRAAR